MSHDSREQSARQLPRRRSAEDWEDWQDDDDVVTPIDPEEQALVESPASPASRQKSAAQQARASSQSASNTTRIKRLRSRHRQKAQNAKAGIRLITDMSNFRRQNQLATQLQTTHDADAPKFVDAAALRALEGDPNSASVGNWNWLRNQKGKVPASATPQSASARTPYALTPGDAPIMIGISLPSEETGASSDDDSRTTPTAEALTFRAPVRANDADRGNLPAQVSPSSTPATTPIRQQISVWSPDTPDTASSKASRAVSSFYSQTTDATSSRKPVDQDVPPVPALPSTYKKTQHQRLISLEIGSANNDDDELGTPCTLFEEDGSPSPQKQAKPKGLAPGFTPDSANSRSHGWWDHVVTPFMDRRFTFASRRTKADSPNSPATANTPRDYHAQTQSPLAQQESVGEKQPLEQALPVPRASTPPIVRAPTPRRTPTPPARPETRDVPQPLSQPTALGLGDATLPSEKPTIVVTPEISGETPPPYSPPRRLNEEGDGGPVRYRAVPPPEHPLRSQFLPSPGPGSPGLAATMTSQGATPMTDIPITPTIPREMPSQPPVPVPSRPMASNLPQEHSHDARGSEHRVERERRRHEREETLARKLGSFWRGRGCIPSHGCLGRPGREGRRRRRVYMGVLATTLVLIILSIVLGVVLTRPRHSSDPPPSIWVNLTDFPPMPTGVLTVAGPENTVSRDGCTVPETIWSCSLPKEEHDSVSPYDADQPTIIMQIQWDNSTSKEWDVPDGRIPKPDVSARDVHSRRATEFSPSPEPPTFADMWFLGNTTDGVKSDDKAGEPAPFYISVLDSTDGAVEQPGLARRQTTVGDELVKDLVDPPDLLADGTPQPARMLPEVKQQPVRLFDRGLPTEHYGFYTYFKRTIFVKSVTRDDGGGAVPADENGGCTKTEANHLVTWGQTRMLVQIWTRKSGDVDHGVKLLSNASQPSIDGKADLTRPGTMPYPVTVSLDTHGGDPDEKLVWQWPMNSRQKLDTENPKLLSNDISFDGELINPRKDNDTSFGGFDGGTGGCKCVWVNWE
ncbi:hypothetical protein GMORB2_6204 [Geosmithia morbida]|uniref:Glycoprotease family protein n=1 Tax=Geosmithia morbida TaxID=1094350 RepID=A0A9P4YUT6_9HYPO|nr:uncharacterized protein GMORB2_6204 [Geosmithia morbida]KAF4123503.1 hypothetical protein GMORB2_6204 [Geosmithia morbida]